MLTFLFELDVGEETKYVGPCGTCGAIRVGAVSALLSPNARRRWREHRGPSAFYDEIDGGLVCGSRVPVCERQAAKC